MQANSAAAVATLLLTDAERTEQRHRRIRSLEAQRYEEELNLVQLRSQMALVAGWEGALRPSAQEIAQANQQERTVLQRILALSAAIEALAAMGN